MAATADSNVEVETIVSNIHKTMLETSPAGLWISAPNIVTASIIWGHNKVLPYFDVNFQEMIETLEAFGVSLSGGGVR